MYLLKKKVKNKTYLYLMESVYDQVTQKNKKYIIESFGNYEKLLKEDPGFIKKLEEEYVNDTDKLNIDKKYLIADFKKLFLNDEFENNFSFFEVNLSYLLLKKMWENELKMSQFFYHFLRQNKNDKIEYNPSIIVLFLSTIKILFPCSYLSCLKFSPVFLADPLQDSTIDDIYRCLHYIANYKDSIIKHISRQISKQKEPTYSLLLFDCTNFYFETTNNDEFWFRKKAIRMIRKILKKNNKEEFSSMTVKELNKYIENNDEYKQMIDDFVKSFGKCFRMYGVSKEKRFDLPIVSLAMVIDINGFPIDFIVFPGNQSEKTILTDVINSLKNKYNIKKSIFVTDSGLNSIKNLNILDRNGLGFYVSKSALTFNKKIRKNELDLSTFTQMTNDDNTKEKIMYKVIPYNEYQYYKENNTNIKYEINCNLMIIFSEKRKERDLSILESLISRAEKAIANKEKISTNSHGWQQLVELESISDDSNKQDKTAKSLKTDLIEKRKECSGFSGILFKNSQNEKLLENTNYNYSKILSDRRLLLKIEDCFRILKHNFQVRPMFVRDRNSITGNIFIGIISLTIIRFIQIKAEKLKIGISINSLIEGLKKFNLIACRIDNKNFFIRPNQFSILNKRGRDCQITCNNSDTNIQQQILKILKFDKMDDFLTIRDLRKYFGLRSLTLSEYQENCI